MSRRKPLLFLSHIRLCLLLTTTTAHRSISAGLNIQQPALSPPPAGVLSTAAHIVAVHSLLLIVRSFRSGTSCFCCASCSASKAFYLYGQPCIARAPSAKWQMDTCTDLPRQIILAFAIGITPTPPYLEIETSHFTTKTSPSHCCVSRITTARPRQNPEGAISMFIQPAGRSLLYN